VEYYTIFIVVLRQPDNLAEHTTSILKVEEWAWQETSKAGSRHLFLRVSRLALGSVKTTQNYTLNHHHVVK
jgi:hypothetical protein